MRIQYIFLIIIGLCITACHKDTDLVNTSEGTTSGPEVILETSGNVVGYIYDEDLQPVPGVAVSTYSAQATTDENGVFMFTNIDLDENGTYIRATKAGYIFGSDMIYPKGNESHSAIQLLRLEPTATFNSAEGGFVEVTGGGSVNFSANSIANADGSAYAGEVIVTAKRIATDDPNLADMMPGGLVAMDAEGATRVLGTLGMLAVELRSPAGDELNLAENQTAELRFKIADDLLDTAPEIIELWSFDEAQGLWIEEGQAKLSGEVYEATVSHFSFWNCDAPFPLIQLCGTVVCPDRLESPWVQVTVEAEGLGTAYGYTDANGTFCGKVPKNRVLTITFGDPNCDDSTVIEVGPFNTNTQLDDILIEKTGLVMNGDVLCNGAPIESGYILVNVVNDGNPGIPFGINADGSYSVSLPQLCNELTQVSVMAINSATGDASSTIIVDIDGLTEVDFDFNVCSECSFDGQLSFDGSSCVDVITGVDLTGGSGNFQYTWSNGSTASTVIVDPGVFICVTVTDTDEVDCEIIKCENVPAFVDEWIEIGTTYETCGNANGSAQFWVQDSMTTTFLVEGPNGYTSTSNPSTDLVAGVYTVTTTNQFGCTLTQSFTITNGSDIGVFVQSDYACGPQVLTANVDGGSPPYIYSWANGELTSNTTVLTSGTYCITVTDSNGCFGEDCIEINISEEPVYTPIVNCNGLEYDITFNSPNNDQFYIVGNTDSLFFQDNFTWDYNILEFGFEYTVEVATSDQCFETFDIQLPNFDGLTTTGSPATCETCTDGWIDINIDPMGTCFDCTVGATAVYNFDDLTLDLTPENDAQNLASGAYVVALFDLNGCMIAYSLVEL